MSGEFIRKCGALKDYRLLRGLLLFAGFMFAAVYFSCAARQAEKNAQAVCRLSLYLRKPLTAEDARILRDKQSDTEFTAWAQQSDQAVADPDLGRKTKTDVITCCGSPELAVPMAGGLSAFDTDGCLIGERTAWELFGGTGVAGDKICVGEETKTIRAVIRQPADCVIVACSELDAAQRFDRITLAGAQAADGEAFLMQSGLDAALLRLDYLRGPGWLAELVPGKWSDFSGWKENIDQKKRDFTLLATVQKNCLEHYYEQQCRRYWRNYWLGLGMIVLAVWDLFWCVVFWRQACAEKGN